ncbi:MAG: hypothetical protein G01um101433_594, partial [Parcubacteria group bacterium Gr01-1014_33]
MQKVNIFAGVILFIMFALMLGSVWNDSATMDELAHIPSGYGYISQLDYRLNPEHPPLLKAISGLFAWTFASPHPYFPTSIKSWQEDINGQWDQGRAFLYESGNDAEAIIFWSRVPVVLLVLLFGWLIFWWTKKKIGNTTALFTLLLFAFSPTFLAHSRYVTTDLAAAFGFFIGIITFLEFLERPTWRNVFVAGIAFGIAQLLKFSLVLLIPIDIALLAVSLLTLTHLRFRGWVKNALMMCGKTVVVGIVGLLLIWGVYAILVSRYPMERQFRDTEFLLSSYGFRSAVNFDLALVKNPVLRPLGQYVLGVLMVQQRAQGGNTAYFLGEISNQGSRAYFPLLYILKEPLALHIMTVIALIFGVRKISRSAESSSVSRFSRFRTWIRNHFSEFSFLFFIAFYWLFSIKSPLNIGVRHVLPTFPFIYILVSRQIAEWLKGQESENPASWGEWFKTIFRIYIKAIPKKLLVAILFVWILVADIAVFPHFLSYYNILVGGTKNGYEIAVDSNYDWGQDLKRLRDFAEENRIEKI